MLSFTFDGPFPTSGMTERALKGIFTVAMVMPENNNVHPRLGTGSVPSLGSNCHWEEVRPHFDGVGQVLRTSTHVPGRGEGKHAVMIARPSGHPARGTLAVIRLPTERVVWPWPVRSSTCRMSPGLKVRLVPSPMPISI